MYLISKSQCTTCLLLFTILQWTNSLNGFTPNGIGMQCIIEKNTFFCIIEEISSITIVWGYIACPVVMLYVLWKDWNTFDTYHKYVVGFDLQNLQQKINYTFLLKLLGWVWIVLDKKKRGLRINGKFVNIFRWPVHHWKLFFLSKLEHKSLVTCI